MAELTRRILLAALAAPFVADGQHNPCTSSARLQRIIEQQMADRAYGPRDAPAYRLHGDKEVKSSRVDGIEFGEHALATCIEQYDQTQNMVTLYGDNIIVRSKVGCNGGACQIIAGTLYKKKFRPVNAGRVHDLIVQVSSKGEGSKFYDRDIPVERLHEPTCDFQETFLDVLLQKYDGVVTPAHLSRYKDARDRLIKSVRA